MKINSKFLLPIVTAGLLTASCDVKERLTGNTKQLQAQTTALVQLQLKTSPEQDRDSKTLYEERIKSGELNKMTKEQIESLGKGHAKLKLAAAWLRDGSISFSDFYNVVVASNTLVVTDENTKLHVDFWGDYSSVNVRPGNIEFWTPPGYSNIILENYTVSQVDMAGGQLSITLVGDEYETKVTDQTEKQKTWANFSPKNWKHTGTKTLTLRLTLR